MQNPRAYSACMPQSLLAKAGLRFPSRPPVKRRICPTSALFCANQRCSAFFSTPAFFMNNAESTSTSGLKFSVWLIPTDPLAVSVHSLAVTLHSLEPICSEKILPSQLATFITVAATVSATVKTCIPTNVYGPCNGYNGYFQVCHYYLRLRIGLKPT